MGIEAYREAQLTREARARIEARKTIVEDPTMFPSPEDEANSTQFFLYSPFLESIDGELEQIILLMGIYKLSKTPEGLKVLRDIAVQYLKTTGVILSELLSAGTANWMNGLISAKLALRVCRRMGLISQTEAQSLNYSYNKMFDALIKKSIASDFFGSFAGLGSLAKGLGLGTTPVSPAPGVL